MGFKNKINKVFLIAMLMAITNSVYTNVQINDSAKVEFEYIVNNVFGLNSKYADFCPVWYNTELVFASDREWNYNTYGEANWDHIKNINLFKVNIKSYSLDSIVFETPKIFNRILISDVHVGPIAFKRDGTEAILSEISNKAHKEGKTKNYNPQLYKVSFENKKLQKKEKLNFVEVQYSYCQPTYSSNGNIIYFVSNIPCENGGKNIFYSERKDEGWSTPKSLQNLNSEGDEMFPTILGNKIYFSSTGFDSYGGLDLFESEYIDGQWTEPKNLGPSINTIADEFSMVFNPDSKSGYFSSNRENGKGGDDIYSFNLIEKIIVKTQYNKIEGHFEYSYLHGSPDKMEVMLLDEDGNLVATTRTDKDGNFVFDYLPVGKKYTIKVNEDGDVVLSLFKGGENILLMPNKYGEFVYRKLSNQGASVMSLIDEGDVELNTGLFDFKGQFEYQKLKGEYPEGMKVFLIDDDGKIVMETVTDKYGNFNFEKLSTKKNYIVKIEDDSEMVMMVFNNVDHLMATMTNDKNGEFVYRLLESDYGTNVSLLSEDEINLKFRKERMILSGNFLCNNSDVTMGQLNFDILDNQGDLLMNCHADSNLHFRYDNLPLLEDLIIKLAETSPYFKSDVKLEIVNRLNEVLIVLEKDEFGMFVYKRMVASKYHTTEVEDLDTTEIVANENKIYIENYMIYYSKNESDIDRSFYSVLDSMIVTLRENNQAIIQVHGHASSTASEEYNMKLSVKRMNKVVAYLSKNGIKKERISSNAFGESQLVNMCEDDKDCEEEMHRLNRRTELKILKQD